MGRGHSDRGRWTAGSLIPEYCDKHEGDFRSDEEKRPAKAPCSETVAVQPDAENEIYTIPGHEHALESEDCTHRHAKSRPTFQLLVHARRLDSRET